MHNSEKKIKILVENGLKPTEEDIREYLTYCSFELERLKDYKIEPDENMIVNTINEYNFRYLIYNLSYENRLKVLEKNGKLLKNFIELNIYINDQMLILALNSNLNCLSCIKFELSNNVIRNFKYNPFNFYDDYKTIDINSSKILQNFVRKYVLIHKNKEQIVNLFFNPKLKESIKEYVRNL